MEKFQTSEIEIFRRFVGDFSKEACSCWFPTADFALKSSSVVIWYLIGTIGLNEVGDVLLLSDNELFERELKADRMVLPPSIDEPLE